MNNEEILAVLESNNFTEFTEASDESVNLAIKKQALKYGHSKTLTSIASSGASPEAECCGVAACSGVC